MEYRNIYKEKVVIGRGNFGVATLVCEKSSGKNYIAKKISLGSLSDYELKCCQLESRLLESLDHPNIVRYKDTFLEPGLLIIVMEYCTGGDLGQLIKSHKQKNSYFPESQIVDWMKQLLAALKYLDSKRIIHRDIKSSNVYITVEGNLKLGDFGIAKALSCTSDVAKTVVGTPYYMSPEVCENKPYSSKSDIWSLGCLFYELVTLNHPFTGTSFLALVMSILKETPKPIISIYSKAVQDLISLMLTKDMNSRPSASDILKFPYFFKSEEILLDDDDIDYDVSSNESYEYESHKTENFGISNINPLELINTETFDGSTSTVVDLNYSLTIPTFTPDIHITEKSIFSSRKCDKKDINDEDEYEDDFESVWNI
jgi:NIMA (never in mitosis gene a)-related kinase 1/4/5